MKPRQRAPVQHNMRKFKKGLTYLRKRVISDNMTKVRSGTSLSRKLLK